jgi:hypothetical protein
MTVIIPPVNNPPSCTPGVDVSFLFAPYTASRISIGLDPRLHEIKCGAEALRIREVFRGFAMLDREFGTNGTPPESFAMIGPGSGIEAIGAGHIFTRLRRITVVDRDRTLLEQAAANIRGNIDGGIEVEAQRRDLWAPVSTSARRTSDILYANLSNVPFTAAPGAIIDRLAPCPPVGQVAEAEVLDFHLLHLHYRFLRWMSGALTPGGCALLMFGGRVDCAIFDHLAAAASVRLEEVVCALKQQTDAWNVVSAHAAAETEHGVEFDFYDYEAARRGVPRSGALSGAGLRTALAPWRLSARAALGELRFGLKIGHTIQLLKATPQG